MAKKIHSTPNDKKGKAGEPTISAGMIRQLFTKKCDKRSAAGRGSGRSNKVNHPPGDRGRTGTAEKGDVDGDGREVECRK